MASVSHRQRSLIIHWLFLIVPDEVQPICGFNWIFTKEGEGSQHWPLNVITLKSLVPGTTLRIITFKFTSPLFLWLEYGIHNNVKQQVYILIHRHQTAQNTVVYSPRLSRGNRILETFYEPWMSPNINLHRFLTPHMCLLYSHPHSSYILWHMGRNNEMNPLTACNAISL